MSRILNTEPRTLDQDPQAPSSKPQAPSSKRAGGPAGIKHQASKKKLDKSSHPRYSRSQGQARDGQAIDICRGPLMGPRNSAAEILQQRPIKSPAIGRNGSCRVMVTASPNTRFPSQAPSFKPQAHQGTSHKHQAPSYKPQA